MKTMIFFIFAASCLPKTSIAADIDDGIDDSSIEEYYEMGKIQKNINFITLNAISKVYTTMDNDKIKKYESSSGNSIANSVIVGAGSRVNGDIIIINKSEGDVTAISNK